MLRNSTLSIHWSLHQAVMLLFGQCRTSANVSVHISCIYFRRHCFVLYCASNSEIVLQHVKFEKLFTITCQTRRPASADTTARRKFQASGQPVSRMQASDAMMSRLPRYEAKCVQCRCFQCGSVPLRSDIKGTELPSANILIPLERQLIALQRCSWQFLYNETLQQTFRPLLSKLSKRRQI